MNSKKHKQVVDAQSDAVYQKVRKLVLSRVEAAIKSGKKIQHGKYGVKYVGEAPVCCVLGAFACNGGEIVGAPERIYQITAPLLMNAGVPQDEVGFVLDALEGGFEMDPVAHYSNTPASRTALCRYLYKYWNEYFELGREIGQKYVRDDSNKEEDIVFNYEALVASLGKTDNGTK